MYIRRMFEPFEDVQCAKKRSNAVASLQIPTPQSLTISSPRAQHAFGPVLLRGMRVYFRERPGGLLDDLLKPRIASKIVPYRIEAKVPITRRIG